MTELTLYNTRTRRKEPFRPLDPTNVRMYVCGPTVYDRAHIGNARPVVVFDTLFRLLRHVYGPEHVTYVRNITDVEDKINARAAESGRPIHDITEETIRWYHEDMGALGALPPTHEPRATAYIGQMIGMIETLVARGHAYAAEGHVLFSVSSYPDYGKLARRSLDEMRAGARVEVAPYKRDPMDFVLWKPSTPDLPGWESPWGRGRPGWHIECSAMAEALLGPSFDIHGGGIDLAFPHHENELAQSMCAHPDAGFANVWMHNGMLNVESEKMSKSLGNFFTVRDLLDRGVPGEVIRFVLLSTHYTQPLDWTERKVEEATRTLRKWRGLVEGVKPAQTAVGVVSALADDLNTPLAFTVLHELSDDPPALKSSAGLFGLLTLDLADWRWRVPTGRVVQIGMAVEHDTALSVGVMKGRQIGVAVEHDTAGSVGVIKGSEARILELLKIRNSARSKRNFLLADKIRSDLERVGVKIRDDKGETIYHIEDNFDPEGLKRLSY